MASVDMERMRNDWWQMRRCAELSRAASLRRRRSDGVSLIEAAGKRRGRIAFFVVGEHRETKRRAFAGLAVDGDGSAHEFAQPLRNDQAQTGAAAPPFRRYVH